MVPDVSVAVTRSLGEALIERAGIARDAEGRWLAGDGRRTSAISEALIWALVVIVAECRADPAPAQNRRSETGRREGIEPASP